MFRQFLIVLMIFVLAVVSGCSNHSRTAILPSPTEDSFLNEQRCGENLPTQLWGYFEIDVDMESSSVDIVPHRSSDYTVNVVKFLNSNPISLSVVINGKTTGDGYVDLDLDITIAHPLSGDKFTGYDVRGVFIGDGSGTLNYDTGFSVPENGTDQILLNNDGYTRWYNPTEFTTETIFGYVPGDVSSKNYTPTATINPYKYYGQGLDSAENLWDYLNSDDQDAGYFLPASSNTRNYVIRFELPSPGFKFGYAVLADWAGGDPEFHPAHASDAVGCVIDDQSDLYYVDDTNFGGNLILDVSVFSWNVEPSAGVVEDYTLFIESDVLSGIYMFDTGEMTPSESGENWNTFHVEIPSDNITSTAGNEMWVIAQDSDDDYTNPFDIPNSANTDPLASFFRFDLSVSNEAPDETGWAHAWGGIDEDEAVNVDTDAAGNVYVTGYFTGTVDFNPGAGADPKSTVGQKDIFLSKYDPAGTYQWTRTWGSGNCDEGRWVEVDDFGNVWVAGYIGGGADFDPGPDIDLKPFGGGYDGFVSKFDTDGNYQWSYTIGSLAWDECRGITIFDENTVYVTGIFMLNVDFDPGDGTDVQSASGFDLDAYISKFDIDGNYMWTGTWGADGRDRSYEVSVDGNGNAYCAGLYNMTVDFDPGSGVEEHTTNGGNDVFVSKFDPDGNFQWVRVWGAGGSDEAYGLVTDSSGISAVTGLFHGNVDFDPGVGTAFQESVGLEDVFLNVLDTDGNFVWARTWGGASPDVGHGLEFSTSGDIFVSGIFMGECDFYPGSGELIRTSNGAADFFLSRFDSLGNLVRIHTGGGLENDIGFSVAEDDFGNYFLTGYYQSDVDFAPVDPPCDEDPDVHSSNGTTDAYLIRYLPDGCW